MSVSDSVKITVKRCFHCEKMGPLTFTCNCEKVFCTACRLPEVHKCTKPKKDTVELVNIRHEKKVEQYNFL
jgi:predicted nucleic acid binding AN1-type Zn finger protein